MMKPINVLLNGFNADCISPLPEMLLEEGEINRIYWLRDHVGAEITDLPKEISLLDTVAVLRQEAGLERFYDREEVSQEIFTLYQKIEPICLKMMDRLERYGPSVPYVERRQIFDYNFFYCLSFLRAKEIKAFISSGVPHEITDFIFAELCQPLGIRTLIFHQVQTDLITSVSHYTELGTERQGFRSVLSKEDAALKLKRTEQLRRQYRPAGKDGPVKHFYMDPGLWKKARKKNTDRALRRLSGKIQHLGKSIVDKKAWRYGKYLLWDKNVIEKAKTKSLWRAYHDLSITPGEEDLEAPFVLLLLHYQPEMTTSPLAEEFVDQYLIARLLISALPPEVRVFVKEHPAQRIVGRSLNYYDLFPKSERLVFIDETYSSSHLMKRALAISTSTGTAGFESIWKGKPVLLFGNAYYQSGPGVYRIRTIADCVRAYKEIVSAPQSVDPTQVEDFLARLVDTCLLANLSDYYSQHSNFSRATQLNCQTLKSEVLAWLNAHQE